MSCPLLKHTALLGALSLALLACTKTEEANYGMVEAGDPLPSFSVRMNDGSVVTDESLKGGVSILVFFGPGCPDCKWQFDELQAFYSEYPGLCRIVSVSRGMADAVPAYMDENGYTFPWSAQDSRKLYDRFSKKGIPSMYICDGDAVVRYTHFDKNMADKALLAAEVVSLLPEAE